MQIGFVIVNYDSAASTLQFVESVLALEMPRDAASSVVVVDNSPTAKDYEQLRRELHAASAQENVSIEVLRPPVNLGYFGGLNVGLDYLRVKRPTFVVVGNADLSLSPEFLINLSNAQYPNDCFVVAPQIVTTAGRAQNPQYRSEFGLFHRLLLRAYYHSYPLARLIEATKKAVGIGSSLRVRPQGELIPIYMGHGSCYVLTPKYFENLRRLPSKVFLFGEEALLSEVVFLYGGRIYYDPTLRVKHDEHTTTGRLPSKASYQLAQASYRIYRRYLYRS